ncbi:hypothetical protein G7Z17_g9259 [Cylindrodendrum hubeiense]|uniref:Glutamine amidotransferase domain-containing protein n=1 Tax=Cylindrodendrum hubeiense TaxID=595255 RepID=A0A9P5H750_9HYPO|nr:hypothetical protein G7Z17_g9259 [Cylindrodendrum hubeiense]
MISKQPSLRVAILRNYDTPAQWGKDMVESWKTSIQAIRPGSEIEVFHPITNGVFPNAEEFDLIILTGGVFNLTLPELDPWVEKTLDFVRTTARLQPGPKIAGICWGHQAICRAMGGKIGWNHQGDVALHKFHKRSIATPPTDFIALAEDHEILLSSNNRMISFQGHPEMTNLVAKGIFDADDGAYTGNATEAQVKEMYARFELPHNGVPILQTVIKWLDE